jgi:hypothetical protein
MPTARDMKNAHAQSNLPPLTGRSTVRSIKPPVPYTNRSRNKFPSGGNLLRSKSIFVSTNLSRDSDTDGNNNSILQNNNNYRYSTVKGGMPTQNGDVVNVADLKRYSISTNSTLRRAVNFNQPPLKSNNNKMLDVNINVSTSPPNMLRRAKTFGEINLPDESDGNVGTNNVNGGTEAVRLKPSLQTINPPTPGLIRRQQTAARKLSHNTSGPTQVKAFSSPSVLAASKSSLCKLPLKPSQLITVDSNNQLREGEPLELNKPTQNDEETHDDEKHYDDVVDEDFAQKQDIILKWLVDVDSAERPDTPPSRFEDYVEKSSSPTEAGTAIHIVYSDGSAS